MAAGKSKASASRRPPLKVHELGALLEDLRSQQDVMLEGIASISERLDRTMTLEAGQRLERRILDLEAVVRQNSADIRKHSEELQKHSEELREMRDELRRLRTDFDAREEKARVAALEARVTRLEQQLKVG